jgi:Na+-translocating ferredoxin:NAD+ oxidoreductase RnfD subunit
VTTAVLAPGRAVRLAGRRVPVELPSVRDPRLHVAACLLTIQVLGQVVVGWGLSIAQLLLCLGTCAAIEVAIVHRQRGVLAWPASALLTGNGIALLLRVPGTDHGDWWSLRGWPIYVGCAALAVLSKHVVRTDDRPVFNPSNVALVLTFLVLGRARVEPQDLWWGPWSPGLAVVYGVLLGGGLVITHRLDVVRIATSFWVTFAAGFGLVVLAGHAISATWHVGPVSGVELWSIVVLSPELLIFLFFMITDPRTIPRGIVPRRLFGAGIGVLAAVLAAPQGTELATKVAVLAALTLVCTARPVLERTIGSRRWSLAPVVLASTVALVGVVGLGGVGDASGRPGFDADLRASALDGARDPRPPLTVRPSADGLLEASMAPEVADDLLADLRLEADALRRGDPDLAATAATTERLDDLLASIVRADGLPADYRIDHLGLFVHRNLGSHQAAPRIGVVAEGTIHFDGQPDAAFHGLFTMEPVQGTWLIAGTAPLTDAPADLR